MTCQKLLRYSAQSIDICDAAGSRVISHCLFWRHITSRAQDFQRVRDTALRFDQSRKTKIGQVRFALCIQQNVARLDISMQDAVLVRVMNNARHLDNEFHRLTDRHRRAPDYFVKLAAFDKLHAEVALAITFANFMDWNDTGMLQASCRFGFEAKALQVRFARPLTKTDDF